MVESHRTLFNDRFTEEKYVAFRRRLDDRVRRPITFRVCETPVFLSGELRRTCEQAALELTDQLLGNDEYLRASDRALHPEITVRGQPARPAFISVDFALTGSADNIVPQLVELQGFPSVAAYQLLLSELFIEHYRLPSDLVTINGGHSRTEFIDVLHRTIIGDHDRDGVVLLDLDPWSQKTCPDFTVTQDLLGIEVVDARDVIADGKFLMFVDRDGKKRRIERIFNRTIADEVQRKGVTLPFRWDGEYDVEWAGHPNWFYRISKFSLPYLEHETVPETKFLSEYDEWPDDPEEFVLKPLFSFAGTGVIVGPSREDLESVAVEERPDYILQRRVRYGDLIATPAGPTFAELRIMLFWPVDEERPRPMMSLVRTGRGEKMGVDANSDAGWIGATCGLFTD